MSILLIKDLLAEDFIALIRQYHNLVTQQFKSSPLVLAFSPAFAMFETFGLGHIDFVKTTEQGRIFAPEGELKWRRVNGFTRVVYLGDRDAVDGLEDRSFELENLVKKCGELVLWGKRTDKKNEWIEQQVPHRFDYPISTTQYSKGRVALSVENWLDDTGVIKFSRYFSLKEIPGEDGHA